MSAESFLDHAASTYADARARIDRIAAHVAASAQDIIDAHANRDWIALGYESWNELCEAEFRGAVIGLPRAERREAVRQMSEAGMSTRAIGGALGVGVATVSRDREETTVPNGTVDDQPREVSEADAWVKLAALAMQETHNYGTSNLHPLCRTHHRLKTHTTWHVRRAHNGEDIWTSPLGNTYTHQPTNPWQPTDTSQPTNPSPPTNPSQPNNNDNPAKSGNQTPDDDHYD